MLRPKLIYSQLGELFHLLSLAPTLACEGALSFSNLKRLQITGPSHTVDSQFHRKVSFSKAGQ